MIEILEKRFTTDPNKVFFIDIDNEKITYNQFYSISKSISHSWKKSGIKTNDKILIKIENSLKLLACYMACAIEGYTIIPLSPKINDDDLNYIVSITNPVLIINDKDQILFNKNCEHSSKKIHFNYNNGSTFCIMFSSGTTGVPKGICLDLARVIGNAKAFSDLADYSNSTIMYHILPMYYMAGLMNSFLAPFINGATIIEGPEFTIGKISELWSRPTNYNANSLVIFPIIASTLCRLSKENENIKNEIINFKSIQCTGNILNENLRKRFYKLFNLPLQDCYGITELGGPLSIQSYDNALNSHNSGKLINDLKYNLISHTNGKQELIIKSPYSMLGYINNHFNNYNDSNGYFKTGDYVTIENESIKINGRVKDIIIRGAKNISPQKIENHILKFDGINEVCVVGIPHDFLGEMIIACIVFDKKYKTKKQYDKITDQIYKSFKLIDMPDRIIQVQEMPKTIAGKVIKSKLIEYLKQQ